MRITGGVLATISAVVVVVMAVLRGVDGHGMMIDPPGRNARLNEQSKVQFPFTCAGTSSEINWSPRSNFCGGRGAQNDNDGKCSACGDNWAAAYPRDHDLGGKYGKNITPVRVYLQGQMISVTVRITASHKGTFEFRLCDVNEMDELQKGRADALTDCFEDPTKYRVLQLEGGGTKYGGPLGSISESRDYSVNVILPDDVTCPRGCSLQWRYEAGNNNDNLLYQEHFVNCADIIIASCDDYIVEKNIAEYCAYGPTKELRQCDGGTGTIVSGNQQQELDGENTGDQQHPGTTATEETSNGNPPCSKESGQQGTGDQTGQESIDSTDSWHATEPPVIAKPTAEAAQQKPLCNECSGLRCDNDCCELTVEGTSSTFDGWCRSNCFHNPPYCPESHCRSSWGVKSRCSRLLHDLLRGLLLKEKELEGATYDGK